MSSRIFLLVSLGVISIAAITMALRNSQEPFGDSLINILDKVEAAYSALPYYSDETVSVLRVETLDGEIIENTNRYTTRFDQEHGAVIDDYLGQYFLIANWREVTNWIKSVARYSITSLNKSADWRDQFVPIGPMIDTEHPGMAWLIDDKTGWDKNHLLKFADIHSVATVSYQGNPTTLLIGSFVFSTQGVNYTRSSEITAPGKLWIDQQSGLIVRSQYDATRPYSETFGDSKKVTLTITHNEISTARPDAEEIEQAFLFQPRDTDLQRTTLPELFTTIATGTDDDGTQNYLLNKPAPEFTAMSLNGDQVSLSELRGKNVLLFFWATWCPNSARAMPQIDALAAQNIENFEVIGVNVNSFVGQNIIRAYYHQRDLSFTTILDPENTITAEYRSVVTPTSILVDANGIIRLIDLGETQDLVNRYTEAVAELEK